MVNGWAVTLSITKLTVSCCVFRSTDSDPSSMHPTPSASGSPQEGTNSEQPRSVRIYFVIFFFKGFNIDVGRSTESNIRAIEAKCLAPSVFCISCDLDIENL